MCGVHLRGQKPLPSAYPRELNTLGDHIRKRRLNLGLQQRDVAQKLGVNVNTVTNWELNRTQPAPRFIPGIIRFLAYVPFDTTGDSLPVPARLKAYRRIHGLSQKKLAVALGVDPSTLARWELGKSQPQGELLNRITGVLAAHPTQSHTAP